MSNQDYILQAKQRVLQNLQGGLKTLSGPGANLQQMNQQRGTNQLQQQREMDPGTNESQVIRDQVLQQYPELANHPQFNQMSGQDIKQLLQQQENQ